MAERTRPVEQMLDLTEETPSVEHLDNQVQKAQEQLLQLKRQQEQIEKQKRELEELSRLEQIRVARESFAQHLELIESIDPRNWNPSDLHKELSRALSTVDDARTEYNEHRSRLQAAGADSEASLPDTAPGVYENSAGRSFSEWLQIGLALSLPLIFFGAVAVALFVWIASRASCR